MVSFLTPAEINALLAAPDRSTWPGRRDHALLCLTAQTGLRVSELTGTANRPRRARGRAPRHVEGKGRKQRATPLTRHSVAVLRTWLAERGQDPAAPLFPTRRGTALSSDAVADLVAKHVANAGHHPRPETKHVTPHVLRHSSAMELLSRRA